MELFTKIAFPEMKDKLDYKSKSTFMGSCFSENIGGWLGQLKFDVSSNLTGTIYNPISIADHITRCFHTDSVRADDLLKSRDNYVHTSFHSVFNGTDKIKVCEKINRATSALKENLLNSDFLFITFGTAIAFAKKSTKEIVNNCHHLPSGEFTKTMLDEESMHKELHPILNLVHSKNPKIKIILTVSPIRHLRHGAIENSRSKARLIRLCELLESDFEYCTYLPVYEFVMDELRDYRFYRQDDLIHLNELGLGLIREKVNETLISKEAFPLMERIRKFNLMEAHKIQNSGSEESKAFLKKIESEKSDLEQLLPSRF